MPAPLSRFARWLVLAGVGAAISGCASGSDDAAAAAHGEAMAEQFCANCHAMGLAAASNYPGAPAFRDMRIDYNAIGYQRRMAQWHLDRVTMPPADVSLADMQDIGAYVRSLRQDERR